MPLAAHRSIVWLSWLHTAWIWLSHCCSSLVSVLNNINSSTWSMDPCWHKHECISLRDNKERHALKYPVLKASICKLLSKSKCACSVHLSGFLWSCWRLFSACVPGIDLFKSWLYKDGVINIAAATLDVMHECGCVFRRGTAHEELQNHHLGSNKAQQKSLGCKQVLWVNCFCSKTEKQKSGSGYSIPQAAFQQSCVRRYAQPFQAGLQGVCPALRSRYYCTSEMLQADCAPPLPSQAQCYRLGWWPSDVASNSERMLGPAGSANFIRVGGWLVVLLHSQLTQKASCTFALA